MDSPPQGIFSRVFDYAQVIAPTLIFGLIVFYVKKIANKFTASITADEAKALIKASEKSDSLKIDQVEKEITELKTSFEKEMTEMKTSLEKTLTEMKAITKEGIQSGEKSREKIWKDIRELSNEISLIQGKMTGLN